MARKVFTVGNTLVERYKSLNIIGISITSICKAGFLTTNIRKYDKFNDIFIQLSNAICNYIPGSIRQVDIIVKMTNDSDNIHTLPVLSTYVNGNVSHMCADLLMVLEDHYIKSQFKNAIEILQYKECEGTDWSFYKLRESLI